MAHWFSSIFLSLIERCGEIHTDQHFNDLKIGAISRANIRSFSTTGHASSRSTKATYQYELAQLDTARFEF
ncbi:hypothetical protein D4S03_04950 [bacterium]|nr:MAG: hypothetical protein D4S03_04950 [bacterium]